MRTRMTLLVLVVGAVGCTGILDLDSYRVGDAAPSTPPTDAGGCAADGCLACILAKCPNTSSCFGSGAMKGEFSGGLCPNYGGCLCHCTDSSCASSCAAQKSSDVACGGCLDGMIGSDSCPGYADCATKCGG